MHKVENKEEQKKNKEARDVNKKRWSHRRRRNWKMWIRRNKTLKRGRKGWERKEDEEVEKNKNRKICLFYILIC
jgi:hypothetical protein